MTGKARLHIDTFWYDAFAIRGSVTLQVSLDVLMFTLVSLGFCVLNWAIHPNLEVDVTPFELGGAALSLLLVLRTNAGYDRWWEGRKLWGGIVNQSRFLATTARANGPADPDWQSQVVRWTIAYAHVTRRTLRGERTLPEVAALLGPEEATRIAAARHMPTAVSERLACLLRDARERFHVNAIAMLPAEQSRNQLLDYLGGCERILRSPLPRVYSIIIRRFIFLFLVTLPFGLMAKVDWLTPLVTLLVAYPILALDQIGVELQNPFDPTNLGSLPLDDYTSMIEGELLALPNEDGATANLPGA